MAVLPWAKLHTALHIQVLFAVYQADSSGLWSVLIGIREVTYGTEFFTGSLQFLSA